MGAGGPAGGAGRAGLARRFLALCEASALLGGLALLAGMLVVLADILARRVLAAPLGGTSELVQLAVVAAACLAMPLAFARGAHVAVTFLVAAWPAAARRWLRRAVAFAETGLLILLLLYGWQQAAARLALGDVSPTLGLPVLLYWLPYLVGIGLALPAALLAVGAERAEAEPGPRS